MSAVIDTNVLIFDTFEDSQLHTEAHSRLDGLERWLIPSTVLHEYLSFMRAERVELDFTRNKMVEYLTNIKTVYQPIEATDILFACREMRNHTEYNDYLTLSVSKKTRQPLLTYDATLRKNCGRLGVKTVA